MKKLKLISLVGLCLISLLSCQNNNEPMVGNNPILNYEGFGESILDGSVTPVSVTINVGDDYRMACVCENRDSLEKAMDEYVKLDCYYSSVVSVKEKESVRGERLVTFYDLEPSTTYYYFVTEDGFNSTDPRKIGRIHSFITEDLKLYVNMGGSVEWCGVNYLENRGEFNSAQFISTSLFSYKDLPNPSEEMIEGDWRYPSKQELQELSETCTVTMVDFNREFVRLTNPDGKNMYIPYTYEKYNDYFRDGCKQLMLIPADDEESGLYILTPDIRLSHKSDVLAFGYIVKCGEELTKYKLNMVKRSSNIKDNRYTDFFHWSYLDETGDTSQRKYGNEKRGVRFVREK